MEEKKKCSFKQHHDIDAIKYCQECKIYMCNKCLNNHQGLFENHHQYNLDKDSMEMFLDKCEENNHPNKLEFFCKNHNKLCCASCVTKIQGKGYGQHKDCDVCFIENIKEEKKNKLKENIKYLENLSNNLDNAINELKILVEKIKENREQLKLKIQKIFTNLRNAINQREDELLLEVDQIFNNEFCSEDIIKEGEKLPNKVKISLEKSKLIDNEWNDNSKLYSIINICIKIENNIKDISLFLSINCAEEIEARIRRDGKNSWIIDIAQFPEEYLYIATAFYTPSLGETGWDFLSITTNNIFSDELQAEAAGRLEAYLTKDRIFNHYTNMLSTAGPLKEQTANFFIKQEEYLLSKKNEYNSDPILYNAYLLYLQFKGLRDEYNSIVEEDKKIEDVEFNVMNSFGDVFDINSKFDKPAFDKMDKEEIYEYFLLNNHCSALFKLKNDLSDIFFGHNSWYYLNMMTRIFKEYNFNFNHPSIKAHNVMFSSYPGSVASNDDFYFTSKGLVVIETTNSNYNETSFDLISEESLLCWQRVQLSNRMATTAKEWTEIFSKYNSGTYNNQYMALDTKNIEFGEHQSIKENTLMILEQLPGLIEVNDVTDHLKFGYWPSYNIPYGKIISENSNITETVNSKPEREMKLYSDYNTCSRANIMRRNHSYVSDIQSMKNFMQYNNYQNDPFSAGNPGETIASRYDLRDAKPICYGAFDTKLGSVKENKESSTKTIHLYSGETKQVTPFSFNNPNGACKDVVHLGIPDEPNYDWITFNNKFNFDE